MNNPVPIAAPARVLLRKWWPVVLLCALPAAQAQTEADATAPLQPVPLTAGPRLEPVAAAAGLRAQAEALYAEGAYAEAMEVCVELARIDPRMPELDELRHRILTALTEQRTEQNAARAPLDFLRAAQDVADRITLPDTYGTRRPVDERARDSLLPAGPMTEVLNTRVSIQLQNASLTALIRALSADEAINMIADENLGEDRQINIDVQDVPLREVLDYIGRHFGIQFHTGENLIWVSARDPEQPAPMETRVFRLRTGIQFHGEAWGEVPEEQRLTTNDIATLTRKATVPPRERSYLEDVINLFVPPVSGSALHVDYNTHTLFVRNTPENLQAIAAIVDALDINPPQILIEARFVEISQADLQEIGIDWILGSPVTLSRTGVEQDGVWTRQPRTVIDEGGSIRYDPYRSDDAGMFPLGPQGAFGLLRPGNPPTSGQGLNVTYRGVLTEPIFSAVIHALEISGRGRTLSVPRVTTLNNNPAKMRDGDDLLYYEEFEAQAFALVDADNRRYTVTALIPKGRPKMAELGFTLVAVPSVGADNRTISLLLTPTISELKEFISYQDETPQEATGREIRQVVVKLPRISRREVQTKVVVDSGETVVMGGLIRTVSQDTVRRVPILGSLPLLGPLFRRTDATEEQRNLIIFVTATVISERGESLVPQVRPAAPPAR
jgi:type IV pilus assembly protein PilQ